MIVNETVRIVRAAYTLRAAFLQFREATWHSHVDAVDTAGRQIVIIEDPEKTLRWQGWFSHYPIKQTPDPQDKAAVLTTMADFDIGHFKKLIEQLFEGIDVDIEEVLIRLQPSERRTVTLCKDRKLEMNNDDHWVMRITSRATKFQWSVDLTGAQYDMHCAILPWKIDTENHIKKLLAVRPFGTLERYTTAMAQLKGTKAMELEVLKQAMNAFHATVDQGMEKKNLSWAVIFGKDDNDYLRHRDKVIKVGRRALNTYVQTIHLNKRRLKAERHDRRHCDEILAQEKEISSSILGMHTVRKEETLAGWTWKYSQTAEVEDS